MVLDPYCGCGTAVHAAEQLDRRWVGIDISAFATALIRRRILDNFAELITDDTLVRGLPLTVAKARALASRDGFEFEKWVCGAIGAGGMFKEPGERGADGGVDGILHFVPIRWGEKPKPEYAIVQVKGGDVSADAVRALETTVRRSGASAGVMVCFRDQMQTVENQRSGEIFRDDMEPILSYRVTASKTCWTTSRWTCLPAYSLVCEFPAQAPALALWCRDIERTLPPAGFGDATGGNAGWTDGSVVDDWGSGMRYRLPVRFGREHRDPIQERCFDFRTLGIRGRILPLYCPVSSCVQIAEMPTVTYK